MQGDQAGSRGGAMRTREFWEEDPVCSRHPDNRKQDVTASLKKVPSPRGNINKNNVPI